MNLPNRFQARLYHKTYLKSSSVAAKIDILSNKITSTANETNNPDSASATITTTWTTAPEEVL